jgi:hypothetical protein
MLRRIICIEAELQTPLKAARGALVRCAACRLIEKIKEAAEA